MLNFFFTKDVYHYIVIFIFFLMGEIYKLSWDFENFCIGKPVNVVEFLRL